VTCIVNGTQLTIEVSNTTCVESVGPVGYSFDLKSKKVYLAVASFLDEKAPVMMCTMEVREPVTFTLSLVNLYLGTVEEATKSLNVFGYDLVNHNR
jgi:hypothetical protein